jgi:hypothetical protein
MAHGLRQALNIRAFPVRIPDKAFRALCVEAGTTHLYSSEITIATSGSPIPVRTSIADLTTIYFHHRGSPRHWIIVPPPEKTKLEDHIRREFKLNSFEQGCSQLMSHLSLWLTPELLTRWDVTFFQVTQHTDQLFVIFPQSYYFGYSRGFSIIESKFHARPSWNHKEYRSCNLNIPICREAHDGNLTQFLQADLHQTACEAEDDQHSSSGTSKQMRKSSSKVSTTQRKYASPCQNAQPPDKPPPRKRVRTKSTDEEASDVAPTTVSTLNRPRSLLQQLLIPSATGQEGFDMSDDDEVTAPHSPVEGPRIVRLQQETRALLRDVEQMIAERNQLSSRKAMYKARLKEREEYIKQLEARLMEREEYIDHLEAQVKEAEVKPWREILDLVQKEISHHETSA